VAGSSPPLSAGGPWGSCLTRPRWPKLAPSCRSAGVRGHARQPLSADELQAIAQRSCAVVDRLGPRIQWVKSYVTDDKVYCVYMAPSAELVREHASQGGFPANRISEVHRMIDPTTAR
jgi:hypothetical protein